MRAVHKINIACGDCLFGGGWTNVDIRKPSSRTPDARAVIADLKAGIPFASSSVDIVYSSHFLEHLEPFDECRAFLDECFRVLKPNGVIRIVVPDFRKVAEIYLGEPKEFYKEYGYHKPWFDKATTWSRRMGISVMFNHKMLYDLESLSEVLISSDFRCITQVDYLGGGLVSTDIASEIVATHVSHSLVVDAMK